MSTNKSNRKRYTAEEKQEVLNFIAEEKLKNKRGAQKAASEKYHISSVTIANWLKEQRIRKTRKAPSSNKGKLLYGADPADLRRLASLLEEIAELEVLTGKLDSLRAEAADLEAKLVSKGQ